MSVWTELQTAIKDLLPERSFGNRGERAAERYLKRRGMKIVGRGYTNHVGEIDLIGVDLSHQQKTVVFIEVKTRSSDAQGHPAEAVDDAKQHQIVQTALVYLRQHGLLESRCRFDIVAILWPKNQRRPQIQHFADAFQPADRGQLFS